MVPQSRQTQRSNSSLSATTLSSDSHTGQLIGEVGVFIVAYGISKAVDLRVDREDSRERLCGLERKLKSCVPSTQDADNASSIRLLVFAKDFDFLPRLLRRRRHAWLFRLCDARMRPAIALRIDGHRHIKTPFVAALTTPHPDPNRPTFYACSGHKRHPLKRATLWTCNRELLTVGN